MSIKTGCEYVGYIDPWTDEERLSDEEIVRCRDCMRLREIGPVFRCEHVGRFVQPDYFCVWGKRRDA